MAKPLRNRATNVQRFSPSEPEARDEGPRLVPLDRREKDASDKKDYSASPKGPRLLPVATHFEGQTVQLTGIYQAIHSHETKTRVILLLAGARFPACPECANVRYRLLRTAPSIHEDPDFRG